MTTTASPISPAEAITLQRELRALTDRFELEALVNRLGRWLDDGRDARQARELLTEQIALDTPGGIAEGIDAVVAQARRNHTVPTQHLITNPLIERDGDRAEITANLLVVFADGELVAAGPRAVELPTFGRALGERYRFEAVRTGDGWRLARIEVAARWLAGSIPA
ncbi:nuclear transport factor 2 family protein [Conexibacter stalactiti]|uniref:Nuclear transport factor 2 family protein n=1 Tax=Conexibacter stalactiti TaxID=1940611 RepID=A0ABU4HPK4_9ACTN|nr:nuclear transport factor 2 family protein [Conexibacter stalactiti]MDW5595248.1 nuclear transport factor 2 family protein [Conexibacter stalactiti]MEC5035890.1 nuclear transport factor 2 family protein [Conexibacter stalactiti]